MQRDRVPHRDVLPEIDAPLLLHAVQNTIVLHVGVSPNAYLMYIAADDRIHPHRSVLAQHHITDNLRRVVDEAGGGNGWPHSFIGSNHAVSGRNLKNTTSA